MAASQVKDWDLAYSNLEHVAASASYPPLWLERSSEMRKEMEAQGRFISDVRYGTRERNVLDIVTPEGAPRGLVVFIHGGYWRRFDKSFFAHMARGPVAHGYAVALPSHTPCPKARVGEITQEIGLAITKAASMVEGPLYITGHSAGGHLSARMVTTDTPLSPELQKRLRKILPISPVCDLRPLLRLEMNEDFRLDLEQARSESPALLEPLAGIDLTAWVGADELPEFVRQNHILVSMWSGFNCQVEEITEPGKHHMNILDGLSDPDHLLTRKLLCL
ncbi:alpha/beta hydrolase [Falsochrobactrum sp. TDYN1]|uniref:Alpha/beta hydrolase n=1 Tax=Falsochrobactrum tianjinense TaxID=2706015 RepID=A0A949PMQ7_9HYPH|nr:alpha/beta hydrolase [Falsochrobactrum sp. TDYN1]